jgi:hypothetical protein
MTNIRNKAVYEKKQLNWKTELFFKFLLIFLPISKTKLHKIKQHENQLHFASFKLKLNTNI